MNDGLVSLTANEIIRWITLSSHLPVISSERFLSNGNFFDSKFKNPKSGLNIIGFPFEDISPECRSVRVSPLSPLHTRAGCVPFDVFENREEINPALSKQSEWNNKRRRIGRRRPKLGVGGFGSQCSYSARFCNKTPPTKDISWWEASSWLHRVYLFSWKLDNSSGGDGGEGNRKVN